MANGKKKARAPVVFVKNLRRLMTETGMKPVDIEKRCGISGRMVSYILDHERTPSLEVADQIASAFGLTLHEMLQDSKKAA